MLAPLEDAVKVRLGGLLGVRRLCAENRTDTVMSLSVARDAARPVTHTERNFFTHNGLSRLDERVELGEDRVERLLERLLVVRDCAVKRCTTVISFPSPGVKKEHGMAGSEGLQRRTLLLEALLEGSELRLALVDALVHLLGYGRDALREFRKREGCSAHGR